MNHFKERKSSVLMNIYVVPTSSDKRAREDEMHSCFLTVESAGDTVVVVYLYFEVSSFEDVSCVEPIREAQPCKIL